MISKLEQICIDKGVKMTENRRVIAEILSGADDHPDVEELYLRASHLDKRISIATVYRTLKLFEEVGAIEKHDFRDGKSRYETISDEHHDHLIDLKTGKVIEFHNPEIERLQEEIVKQYGYKLVDHRLKLYCVPLENENNNET